MGLFGSFGAHEYRDQIIGDLLSWIGGEDLCDNPEVSSGGPGVFFFLQPPLPDTDAADGSGNPPWPFGVAAGVGQCRKSLPPIRL